MSTDNKRYVVSHQRGIAGVDEREVERVVVTAASEQDAIAIASAMEDGRCPGECPGGWPGGRNPEATQGGSGNYNDYWMVERCGCGSYDVSDEPGVSTCQKCMELDSAPEQTEQPEQPERPTMQSLMERMGSATSDAEGEAMQELIRVNKLDIDAMSDQKFFAWVAVAVLNAKESVAPSVAPRPAPLATTANGYRLEQITCNDCGEWRWAWRKPYDAFPVCTSCMEQADADL